MFSYQNFKSYKTTIGSNGMNCIWEPICQRLLFKCVIIEHPGLCPCLLSSPVTLAEIHMKNLTVQR